LTSNSLGDAFRLVTFGESHGPAVGVVLDGVQPGLELDDASIQAQLDRRRPGRSEVSSARNEPDRAEILSGVFEGRTTGAPICILVRNRDARSGDYDALKDLFRPGHGDMTWLARYGVRDWRGGGRLSGRETVARVAAGAVARRLLEADGVVIRGHVIEAAGVQASTFDAAEVEDNVMRCGDPVAAAAMEAAVLSARADGDSVGGVLEVVAEGVPAGWGDPLFGKLDARLAGAMMSIGAVKGVEVGAGFAAARMRGSEHNDALHPDGFASNHAGGVLAGISSGAPIVMRLAIKPTPSIRRAQQTLDRDGEPREISIAGRHDPCICPRAVPVAEAMMAIVLADARLARAASGDSAPTVEELRAAVDRSDATLLRELGRRFALVGELVQAKVALGRPPLDVSREAELMRTWSELGSHYGLDGALTRDLLDRVLAATRGPRGD
jgi:chorismate synthase